MKKLRKSFIVAIAAIMLFAGIASAGYTTCNGIGVYKSGNIVSLYNRSGNAYSAAFYRSGRYALTIWTSRANYAVGYSGITYVVVRNNGNSVGCAIQ